jgi:hypothetical protein
LNSDLIRELDRRTGSARVAVEPVAAPPPLPAAPEQEQDVAAAAGGAQDRSEEVDGVILLPLLGDETLVLPEVLEELGMQSDVALGDIALQALFAGDALLALLETVLQLDLAQVDLGQSQGPLVLVLIAFQALTVDGALPNAPACADELGRVEWRSPVDQELDRPDDHLGAVFEEGGELAASLLGVANDLVLEIASFEVDLLPVCIGSQGRHDLVRLIRADSCHNTPPKERLVVLKPNAEPIGRLAYYTIFL